MRVLIIDFYHSTTNVGGLRWRKFAKYLPAEGIDPVILTSGSWMMDHDNVFHVPYLFNFKASHGFAYGRDDSLWGKAKRFLRGNLFIPDPRRLWFCAGRASALITRLGIDTVITTGPPHSVHLVGMKLKRWHDIKWIADFRDPWESYWFKDLYLTGMANILHGRLWGKVLRNADRVIQVEDMVQPLVDPVIIPNCFDPDDFAGEQPGVISELVYVGSLTDRSLLPSIEFKHIHGVSHEEAIKEMRQAGYLLVAYPADVIPSKVYEYMASGRPIVSYGLRGKGAELIERTGTGWHFNNYDKFNEFFGIKEVTTYQHPFVKLSWVVTRFPQPKRNEKEIQKYNVKNITKQLAEIIKTTNQ